MSVFSRVFSHVGSGSSSNNYYSSMNKALFRFNKMYTMLHYPMYRSEGDSFIDAQTNLSNYCMSLLPSVEGKKLLEVGCGNGVQANYIFENYTPDYFKAIDLNADNIESVFHYPEKTAFFRQMYRVLKPGGSFVIADILTTKIKRNRLKDSQAGQK